MRKRQSKPLNLSAALAQSSWAGELPQAAMSRRPVRNSEPEPSLAAESIPAPESPAVTQPGAWAHDAIFEPAPAAESIPVEAETPEPPPPERREPERREAERRETAPRAWSPADLKGVRTPAPARRSRSSTRELGSARYAYLVAGLAGLVWAGSFIAFVVGFEHGVRPLDYPPFQAVVLAVLTVLPTAFMLLAAFAVRQGARLGADVRRAHRLAKDLVQPAALAALESGELMGAVRSEVERAVAASRSANLELSSLRGALALEGERLTDAAGEAQRTSRVMAETLTRERDGVAALAAGLHAHADEIAESVGRQTRLVADASDLARNQLQEAEATLAARAADLTQTTAAAVAATRDASDQLGQQNERLDATGSAVAERLRELETRLAEERDGLGAILERCNLDQDDIAARLETRRAQLIEAVAEARVESDELNRLSGLGAEALRSLIGQASDQVGEVIRRAAEEQAALSQTSALTRVQAEEDLQRALTALGSAANDAYGGIEAQAEQVRRAAGHHVETAKAEVEQLGELAFDAGQRANKAFDARISEARRLIEQSAAMIEDAGQRSAARIETGLDATRAAIADLAGALVDIDTRMARLPQDTRERADAVRQAVDRGVGELTAAARRVAEETQAIDSAFQDRVRRNYETLSEAARLMERMAGSPPAATSRPSRAPIEDAPAPAATERSALPPLRLEPLVLERPQPGSPTMGRSHPGEAEDDLAAPEPGFRRNGPQPPAAAPEPKPSSFTGARANGSLSPPVFGRAATRPASEVEQAFDAAFAMRQRPAAEPEPQPASETGALTNGAAEPAGRASPAYPPQPYSAHDVDARALRPRLKLTPTEADAALKTVFDPLQARGREAEAARPGADRASGRAWEGDMDEWTWKDLLSSIDERPKGEDALAEQMIGEIAALGVDAGALLPRARVEEIAASLSAGDPSAARDSVRRLAPAAIRRLSRRVLTDAALREQADRYVRQYEGLLRGSVDQDRGSASTLLSSDPGRAYLLLDAAVGDLH